MSDTNNKTEQSGSGNYYVPDARLEYISCYCLRFEHPVSYKVSSQKIISCYCLLEGTVWLECPDASVIEIKPGTVVAFTRPYEYIWHTTPPGERQNTPTQSLDLILSDDSLHQNFPEYGDENSPNPSFFVGTTTETTNLMPETIPPYIILRVDEKGKAPGFWTIIELLKRPDIRAVDDGGAIRKRLGEAAIAILTNYGLRYISQTISEEARCTDQRIRRVLIAIHNDLQKDWTLEEMADLATMSRAGVSDRFRRLIGDTPINYLNRLRMQHAASLLHTTPQSINQIAWSVGYQSSPSFTKAFTKKVGLSPGQYRDYIRAGKISIYNGSSPVRLKDTDTDTKTAIS